MGCPCFKSGLLVLLAAGLGWQAGRVTIQREAPEPTVLPMRMTPASPQASANGTVKICFLSGAVARSRCPYTEQRPASQVTSKELCSLHAKVCPIDGELKSLLDPDLDGSELYKKKMNAERLYCETHGAKLLPVE
jgi:hypothetical protein